MRAPGPMILMSGEIRRHRKRCRRAEPGQFSRSKCAMTLSDRAPELWRIA